MKRFFSAIAVSAAVIFAASVYADYDFKEEIIENNIGYNNFGIYDHDTIVRYYTGYRGATMDEYNNPQYYCRITRDNTEKLSLKYEEKTIDGTEYKIIYNDSYKIVDGSGKTVIDSGIYSYMYPHDGVVTVCRDGKYGIITAEGEVIKPIETEIDLYKGFNDYGLGACRIKSGEKYKYALINSQLEFLSDYEFININFIGEYASAAIADSSDSNNKVYALIDRTGKQRTPFRYSALFFEKEKDICAWYGHNNGGFLRPDLNNSGVLRPDLTEYIDISKYSYSLVDDRLILSRGDEDAIEYAIADLNGNIISGWYKHILSVGSGFFRFTDNDKYGLMNKAANIVIPAEYDRISVYSFGRILCSKNGMTYVYDFDFNKLAETDGYIDCGDDKNPNRICRACRDGKYAFVDENGKRLTDYIYDSHSGCCQCIDGSTAYYAYYNGECKYYDENMNEINKDVKLPYLNKTDIGNYSLLNANNRYAFVDRNTQSVVISYNDGYNCFNTKFNELNNTLMFDRDRKHGVIDFEGNELFSFDGGKNHLLDSVGGFYRFLMSDGVHLFDCSGRDVFGKGYKDIERLDNGIVVVNDNGCLKALRSETINIAYNTDIRTYINGAEIPCYKADGFNVVAAEDLGGYGFDVIWNGDEHRLYITRNSGYYTINPVEMPEKGEKNTAYRDILYSDIEVYYEGHKIKSYTTEGKTLIDIGDMESGAVSVTRNGLRADISVNGLENRIYQ